VFHKFKLVITIAIGSVARLAQKSSGSRIDLTKKSSATAGGGECGKHSELFHKIKCGLYNGQRLAPALC
jgi:hypothetical protein